MGYFSNLAITSADFRTYWEKNDHSYFGPCEQLQLHLKELLYRFDELNLPGVKKTTAQGSDRELFGDDLEYVLPEDMKCIFDVILAIEVTRRKLRSKYGISSELGNDSMITHIVTYEHSRIWKQNINTVNELLWAA